MFVSENLCVRAVLLAVLFVPAAAAGEDQNASQAPASLSVQIKVVRVNVTKLKSIGFDWVQLVPGGAESVPSERTLPFFISEIESGKFEGFLEALRQNSLATVLAEPTIVTLDGRPASLKVGGTQLDVVTIILGDGRVRLDYRLECEYEDENGPANRPNPTSKAQLVVDSSVILPTGKGSMLIRSPSSVQKNGKVTEYHTIVLAKVERSDQLAQKSGQSHVK